MRSLPRLCLFTLFSLAPGCLEKRDEARQEADQKPVLIALGPEALLQEGAIARIQDALASRNFGAKWKKGELDSATVGALQRAQKSLSLPATGVPDARTVELLGLSAADVFKRRD